METGPHLYRSPATFKITYQPPDLRELFHERLQRVLGLSLLELKIRELLNEMGLFVFTGLSGLE